jgi:hypothetical protein
MKKLFMASVALVTFALAVTLFQMSSCKKSDAEPPTTPCDPVCIVKGTYAGTYTNQYNMTATFAYLLADNNFISGAGTVTDVPTAFGGYWNSCDSIKINTWNSVNDSYYYFAGKFSTDKNTITGIYKNLTTTSEVGTFTLAKQ